jgi:hypothetical protein
MYNDDYPKQFKTAEEAKEYARFRLYQTDYSVLNDVNISNKEAFVRYRILLRSVIQDPHGAWVFPKPPEPQWIKPGDMIDQSTEESIAEE